MSNRPEASIAIFQDALLRRRRMSEVDLLFLVFAGDEYTAVQKREPR